MTDAEPDTDVESGTASSEPESGPTRGVNEPVSLADPELSQTAIDRVRAVIESGSLADGAEVRTFEREFAAFCGADHGVATSNGTTALHAALEALGVEDGDAVVTSPFSFVASANAIRLAGGVPVFADIDPETYTIDPDAVERIVRKRDDIVGLLPVHLYGLPADMPSLLDIADDHDLFVLEDACQAHGGAVEGSRVGQFGDAACFSFYPTKNMTTGEGGMVTTTSEDVADAVARYANHGRGETGTGGYDHVELGHNFRLTSIAAAIGRTQLERLPSLNDARRETAAVYNEELADLPVETPTEPRRYRHVYHQYTVRVDDRVALVETLDDHDVDTGIYYETPIHRQPAYESVSTAATHLPEAEGAAASVLSLPVHPGLSDRDRRTVVDAVKDHYNST